MMAREEAEYFSKDFEWEELRSEVENNPSFTHHFLPFNPSSSTSSCSSNNSHAWGNFHTRHSTGKFFKERRYLLKEFPELLHCDEQHCKVLEVGCGNGSTVLPIIRGNQHITIYACDCSSEALERTKDVIGTFDKGSINQRFHPFVCDFSLNEFPSWLVCKFCRKLLSKPNDYIEGNNEITGTELDELASWKQAQCCVGGMDFVTLIFTLSAVPFQRMPTAILECISVLKPGGLLLFRDYGLYDMTMLRFEPNKRVGLREYMRSDGTLSHFFSLDTVRELFLAAGFIELELEYCCIKSVNRRKGNTMHRVWVHGKFQRPI